jgi:transketolase
MEPIRQDVIARLKAKALDIKKDIIRLAVQAQEGHCASALSIADIVTALYFHRLRIEPRNPGWEDRDRFILSKGHACQALYVALHHAGFFDRDKLHTFLQKDTGLAGHPVLGGAPGVEASTGSLGQGFSVSVGLALGAHLNKKKYHVFTVIGDGESNEGIVWEAALAASHYKLDNLTAILDRNNYQCDGYADRVMKLDPVDAKWISFGWEVRSCDGHRIEELIELLDTVPFVPGRPSLVLASTVKGKGVDFMESNAQWHYRAPTNEQLEEAILQLERACRS